MFGLPPFSNGNPPHDLDRFSGGGDWPIDPNMVHLPYCLLRITDSSAKNYQRNSDIWVGFSQMRL